MFRTACAAVLALIVGASSWGSALAAPVANTVAPPIVYQQRTLANGLQVLTSRDPTTPNVTVQVWYGVGSKDDPEGRSGFAHLFEHLMFKATRNLPAESMDRLTEDVGGENNASTADDYTNYYEVVPANHLERLLWVEAERMTNLVVDEATFKSERDVVKEELRQHVLAAPYGRLMSLYLPQASYQVHPYKRPGIGSIEELDAATVDDVRAFHQTYYRPDNATLIVVGNFDPTQLDAWIDRDFGVLQRPPVALPKVTAREPLRTQAGVFNGYGPNVPLPAVVLTWQGPGAASADAAALTVLDAILSAGKSSRLYNSLVYDKHLAAEAFSIADLPHDPGMFVVGAILASGHSIPEGETALLAEVRRLREAPPSAAEMAEAKTELLAGALRERETINGRAHALGYALRISGDAAAANTDLAALQAVTGADIQRVAQRYLAEDRRITIKYRPETERPKGEAPPAPPTPPKTVATYTGPVVALAPEAERLALPALGEPVQPVLPQPAETTLANGLRVIVARSSNLPLISAALIVKVGAWADPEGLAGAAAMTADMLTEGTKTRSAQQIARQVESLGAALGSSGGLESSSVTLNVMPGKLQPAMAILADVVRHPAFAAEELDRQREQALDGLRVSYQEPGDVAAFAAAPVIFGGTRLGHVAQGTPASLGRMKVEDLARLHATAYRPDNAVLVLTGDINAQQGFALAKAAFGDWAHPATPLAPEPKIRPEGRTRAVVIDLPGTGQASVNVAGPAIARNDAGYYPAIVASTVLGGGYSARLNQEIRIKRGLSYGASARLTTARTTGSFRASAQTKNESAPQVLDLIRAEMARLGAELASTDELKGRKSALVGAYGRQLATADGLAAILGNLALYGVPLDEVTRYTAKVQAVSTEQVTAAARRIFNPAAASVIIAGDAKLFAAGLDGKVTNLELIPVDQLDLDSPTLRKAKPEKP